MKNTDLNNRHLIRANGLLKLLMVIALMVCFPVKGQIKSKKILTEADYPLWHYLDAEEISDDGKWISYTKSYPTADSLFLHQRKTGKIYFFPGASRGQFAADHFVYKNADNTLHLLSLKKGISQVLKNIKSFDVFGSYLLVRSDQKENSSLAIYTVEGRLVHTQDNVLEYALCPDKKKIALSVEHDSKNILILTRAENFEKFLIIAQDQGTPFKGLTWSSDANALAFLHYGEAESKLYYYQVDKNTLSSFSTAATVFPQTMNIASSRPLKISNNNKVFFRIAQRRKPDGSDQKNEVQIWNAADKSIYPMAKQIEGWNIIDKQALWEPESGRFLQFTDSHLPYGAAAGDLSYALTFNPQDYEPQSNDPGDRDIYITNLNTGERKLLLKKHSGNSTAVLASPAGKYISYFKKGNWYVYDVHKDSHAQVNVQIPYPLSVPGELNLEESYGNPGWTSNDDHLLIYDQYDIWRVSPSGTDAIRLTKGREKGIVYRIVAQTPSEQRQLESRIYTNGFFNLKEGLLLTARSADNFYNGIFLWDLKKGLSEICYTDKKISTILRSKNNTLAWMQEDAELPWQIKAKEAGSKETLVMQSNPQQESFNWTRREMVTYQNQKGESLKGILYYPATYQKEKTYPMVVHIYEKQSYQAHYYYLPTLYNGDGFNIANLTAKDYFVFLPDITYEIGNVGLSAVDCVEAAVKSVLNKHEIDPAKVALIGHSFGGFQTNFIITHSKLFACAVSGAATSNFLSSYLAVSESNNTPNFAKIEYGQARMKVSPYENMDRYLKNSPVMYASNIATPLLSWTGLKDLQVAPTQSLELYMALRRLGRTHIMVAYPDEGHDITGKENAIDLTRRIEQWFDYYLKDSQMPTWLK